MVQIFCLTNIALTRLEHAAYIGTAKLKIPTEYVRKGQPGVNPGVSGVKIWRTYKKREFGWHLRKGAVSLKTQNSQLRESG